MTPGGLSTVFDAGPEEKNYLALDQTVLASKSDFATCIENIDVGDPAMIRVSAKNNNSVAIVASPAQYDELKTDD